MDSPQVEHRMLGVKIPFDDVEAIHPTQVLLEGNVFFPDPLVREGDRLSLPETMVGDHFVLFDPNVQHMIRDGQVLVEFGRSAISDLRNLGIEEIDGAIELNGFKYVAFEGFDGYHAYSAEIATRAREVLREEISTTSFGITNPKIDAAERRISLEEATSETDRYMNTAAALIHGNPTGRKLEILVHTILFANIKAGRTREEEFALMDSFTQEALEYYLSLKEEMRGNPEFGRFAQRLLKSIEKLKKEISNSES